MEVKSHRQVLTIKKIRIAFLQTVKAHEENTPSIQIKTTPSISWS